MPQHIQRHRTQPILPLGDVGLLDSENLRELGLGELAGFPEGFDGVGVGHLLALIIPWLRPLFRKHPFLLGPRLALYDPPVIITDADDVANNLNFCRVLLAIQRLGVNTKSHFKSPFESKHSFRQP